MKNTKDRITALLEFSQTGGLVGIFLNAQTKNDEAILQRGLSRLLKPEKMGLVRRLFTMVKSGK